MNCKICCRQAEDSGFCPLHLKAYKNVFKNFQVWVAASNVSWCQYLEEIQKNSLTGLWAKDVAKYLIEEETKR